MFCFYPSKKEEEDIKLIFEKLILGRFTYCTKKKFLYEHLTYLFEHGFCVFNASR